jgi:hypothetical protein
MKLWMMVDDSYFFQMYVVYLYRKRDLFQEI